MGIALMNCDFDVEPIALLRSLVFCGFWHAAEQRQESEIQELIEHLHCAAAHLDSGIWTKETSIVS
jgi:hypothetical protein